MHWVLRFQILFHMALAVFFLSFFSTRRAIWNGVCTSVTVDHVTVALWSLWVLGYLVTLGIVHLFRASMEKSSSDIIKIIAL